MSSTTTAASSSATVFDSPTTTILDTRAIDWEESDYVPGALRRVLARDTDGDPIVLQRWMPPSRKAIDEVLPGAYHLAREAYFCLGGERHNNQKELGRPGEFVDPVIYREGYWLDRQPGSVHGGPPTPIMAVGVWWIGWMAVSDDFYVGLDEASTLTDVHPAPGERLTQELPPLGQPLTDPLPASVIRVHRAFPGGAQVLKTREMEWDAHPHLPESHIKVLCRNHLGEPAVELWALPNGRYPVPELPYRVSHRYRDITYVIKGELRVREYAGPDDTVGESIVLRDGYFVDRKPGSVYGYDTDEATPTGIELLHFRVREGAQFGRESDKHPRLSRDLNPAKKGKVLPPSGLGAKPYASEDELLEFLRQQLKR